MQQNANMTKCLSNIQWVCYCRIHVNILIGYWLTYICVWPIVYSIYNFQNTTMASITEYTFSHFNTFSGNRDYNHSVVLVTWAIPSVTSASCKVHSSIKYASFSDITNNTFFQYLQLNLFFRMYSSICSSEFRVYNFNFSCSATNPWALPPRLFHIWQSETTHCPIGLHLQPGDRDHPVWVSYLPLGDSAEGRPAHQYYTVWLCCIWS